MIWEHILFPLPASTGIEYITAEKKLTGISPDSPYSSKWGVSVLQLGSDFKLQ